MYIMFLDSKETFIASLIDNKNLKAILATFGTSTDALLDFLTGK